MDIAPFQSDIRELIEAFMEIGGLELSQMKELWRLRSFSFIHEARPNHVEAAFFMQALYSCALSHMVEDLPLSEKLGGLYVLYILYETQLFTPAFKIYLSKDDLQNIYSLVKEAKVNGPLMALKVVHKMMARDFFLFGFVSTNQQKITEAADKLSNKSAARLQRACKRLLSSASAKQHFEGNLIKELGLEELAMLTEEYAMVKQRLYSGAKQSVENGANDIAQHGALLGDELKKDIHGWMEHRKSFFRGKGADDGFELELERTLEEE